MLRHPQRWDTARADRTSSGDVLVIVEIGGPGRNRTGIRGFAVRCITTLPPDPRCGRRYMVRQAGMGQERTRAATRPIGPPGLEHAQVLNAPRLRRANPSLDPGQSLVLLAFWRLGGSLSRGAANRGWHGFQMRLPCDLPFRHVPRRESVPLGCQAGASAP
jgi:hypothetical protein